MLARARFVITLFFLASLFTASAQTLIPTDLNVGSHGGTFDVTQGVIVWSIVIPSAGTAVPTGTVQFLANGTPIGPPYAVGPELPGINNGAVNATLPISVPGSYTITSTYSGDATHTSAASYNSWPVLVMQNPPTVTVSFASSSLTLASGATTGNTDLFSLDPINGFHGSSQFNCTVSVNPGTPAPAYPAACALSSAIAPNGNVGFLISITTVVPRNLPVALNRNLMLPSGAVLCAFLVFMPRLRRNRPRMMSGVLTCFLALSGLSGCGASYPIVPVPVTTVQSSAGSYTVTIQGQAYDQISGDITVFSGSIPLTVT